MGELTWTEWERSALAISVHLSGKSTDEISPSRTTLGPSRAASTKNAGLLSEGARLTQDSTASQQGGVSDEEIRATYVRGERNVPDASMMDYW